MEFFGARPERQIAPSTDAEDGAGGDNAEEVNERSAAVTGRPERRHAWPGATGLDRGKVSLPVAGPRRREEGRLRPEN
jgi:hypothetical protein